MTLKDAIALMSSFSIERRQAMEVVPSKFIFFIRGIPVEFSIEDSPKCE